MLLWISFTGCGGAAPATSEPTSKQTEGSPREPTEATGTAHETQPSDSPDTSPEAKPPEELMAEATASVTVAETGAQLFDRHCATCHGVTGDGNGLAADLLFPRPRNLRIGRFRLVSTSNGLPTPEDIRAVLLRGMPGSAMPPWAHLADAELDALVDHVLKLRRDGAADEYQRFLKEDELLTDEEIAEEEIQQEIAEHVEDTTTPGESTPVPEFTATTPEAVARGRDVYANFACIQCHGETGRGDGAQRMVDDDNMPTRPRDFTIGIFKGPDDPTSLYRRIAYGMPGTPMPASTAMTPEQMVDLVHFVRSLSTDEQRQSAVLKRSKIVARRLAGIPAVQDDDAWNQVVPAELRLTPLWWRDDSVRGIAVQAVHDGETLAVRLSWNDTTPDRSAVKTEQFEDAVAMQLYRGASEPFLGMGSRLMPVDIWLWDADRQSGPVAAESAYPDAVVDVYPFHEGVVASAEFSRSGARLENQPEVSLPARASGNLITPASNSLSGGSSLYGGGPRTLTFRLPTSQLVRADGHWHGDHWTVVMQRPLDIDDEDGVPLEPGAAVSVAFAVWDGSHQDRNGQKSFTIWQDLEIEH